MNVALTVEKKKKEPPYKGPLKAGGPSIHSSSLIEKIIWPFSYKSTETGVGRRQTDRLSFEWHYIKVNPWEKNKVKLLKL